mgnify:CR=1 FL=1
MARMVTVAAAQTGPVLGDDWHANVANACAMVEEAARRKVRVQLRERGELGVVARRDHGVGEYHHAQRGGVADAGDEIGSVDVRAMDVQEFFEEDADGDDPVQQDQPHQRPSLAHDGQHVDFCLNKRALFFKKRLLYYVL